MQRRPTHRVDDDRQDLGQKLQLPPWLEPQRDDFETSLQAIELASRKEQEDHKLQPGTASLGDESLLNQVPDNELIHELQPVYSDGVPLEQARAAMILVHGRGATAPSILTLAQEVDRAGFAYLAPQAANNTWYPQSFLAPIERNQPYLASALRNLDNLVHHVLDGGVAATHLILLGFSQGACLALEYVARHPRRYGAAVGLSGGLIGPPGTPRDYDGTLEGTPVFLGCSNVDPHIPEERVEETTQVLRDMGAEVTKRIYAGMGHTVNEDELNYVRRLMAPLVKETDGRNHS